MPHHNPTLTLLPEHQILEVHPRKKLISCEFNIDTACVELKYSNGSMISINCTAVEYEVANSRFQRSELDWLIYNDPLSYAELILNGDPEEYANRNRDSAVRSRLIVEAMAE